MLACLIIDDPLLRPRYGCLSYKELLKSMKEHRFFTEIAFIPWNYRRSDPETVRVFADNPEYFGLCVHGCNHTAGEFGRTDYKALSALASSALWRMEQHSRITGLPYDPVMVFPQGIFSSAAILALKEQGFRSAVNSTLRAIGAGDPPASEYHGPAATAYHGFPMFMRRYPQDRTGFLRDAASGRPLIIVEHHTAFRDGFKELLDFIDWVNGLGRIKWKSLAYITDHFCGKEPGIRPNVSSEAPVGAWDAAKVMMRRHLCEARDNYIHTNPFLDKVYKIVKGGR
jgi:hypothetical protein